MRSKLISTAVLCRVLKGEKSIILRLTTQTNVLILRRMVMSVSDRKARPRTIPVLFGLDPAPPSFRYAHPPERYVCMAITYSRVWINRVRLPILLVVSSTGKIIFPCPRACLRIWSRETGSAVPSRASLLISILRLNLVLTYGIPPGADALDVLWARHSCAPRTTVSGSVVPDLFRRSILQKRRDVPFHRIVETSVERFMLV